MEKILLRSAVHPDDECQVFQLDQFFELTFDFTDGNMLLIWMGKG